MSIESDHDLRGLQAAGRVVALALRKMREAVLAGISTAELDRVGARVLADHGARSAPQSDYGFPGATCISVNDEAVHGVPGPRTLREGDVVTLDVTVELDGYYADAAVTVGVAPIGSEAQALLECAEAAFWSAARLARPGAPLARVGGAVEAEVRRRGFRVLRELCGHGIGRRIHEEPSVANYFEPRVMTRLTEGLVIALEPIISAGSERVRVARDGWTIASADGSLSAHFEHTLAVSRTRPVILTAA